MTSESSDNTATRRERIGISALLAASFVLRIFYIFRYRFDSDEPQHLHVVWSWTQGLLQYRDVFDNHTPLFQMLCAPLAGLLGQRANLLVLMRLAMLPLFAVTLWTTYRIAKALFSDRIGRWAAAATGLFYPFFAGSVEFRTDDLWAMCWLLTVMVIVEGPLTSKRGIVAGLFLGATTAASMKTTLLVGCMLIAVVITLRLFSKTHPWRQWQRENRSGLISVAVCSFIIPLALAAYFYARGAIGPLFYCIFTHNIVPDLKPPWLKLFFIPLVLGLSRIARLLFAGNSPQRADSANRASVFLLTTTYLFAVLTLWPLITQEDFLPAWPLLVIFLTAWAAKPLPKWFGGRLQGEPLLYRTALLPGVLIELALLLVFAPWHSQTTADLQKWKNVLKFTRPDEYVLDLKGGLIFRRRACYYVFEKLTKKRIGLGWLKTDIPNQLIKKRTCVVGMDLWGLPAPAVRFIENNYLPVGPFRVAGKHLAIQQTQRTLSFEVVIPAVYRLISHNVRARGLIDGKLCTDTVYLSAGRHTYHSAPDENSLELIWARIPEESVSFGGP